MLANLHATSKLPSHINKEFFREKLFPSSLHYNIFFFQCREWVNSIKMSLLDNNFQFFHFHCSQKNSPGLPADIKCRKFNVRVWGKKLFYCNALRMMFKWALSSCIITNSYDKRYGDNVNQGTKILCMKYISWIFKKYFYGLLNFFKIIFFFLN